MNKFDAGDRSKLVAQWRELAQEYADQAEGGYGASQLAGNLHKLLDRITSNVYGQQFAYCGRTHTSII